MPALVFDGEVAPNLGHEAPSAARPGGSRERPLLLYILHSGDLYGTEKVAVVTSVALHEYRRKVILAPPGSRSGSSLEAARQSGLEAWPYSSRRDLVTQLLRLMRREPSLDVITTSITQSLIVAAVAFATRTRIRHLHAVHGNGDTSFRWKPVLAPLKLRYVAVSTHVRQRLQASRVPSARIDIAENFLSDSGNLRTRQSYADRGMGATSGQVRVVVIGRADPLKRLDMLVSAVATGELSGYQFDVFGNGPELESLRAQAAQYPNLCFHGYVDDASQRLAEADILLHTCDVETFGLVVLEAFQTGVVAIVPDAGGTGTLVDPGITGLTYKARDVSSMVAAIRHAGSLPSAELDLMVGAAKEQMATRFSRDYGIQAYRDAFAACDCR